jgi:hypothetical protein
MTMHSTGNQSQRDVMSEEARQKLTACYYLLLDLAKVDHDGGSGDAVAAPSSSESRPEESNLGRTEPCQLRLWPN